MMTPHAVPSLDQELLDATGLSFDAYRTPDVLDAVHRALSLPRLLHRVLFLPTLLFTALGAAVSALLWTLGLPTVALFVLAVGLPLAVVHGAIASAIWIRRIGVRDAKRLVHVGFDLSDEVLTAWRVRVLIDGSGVQTIPLVSLMRGILLGAVRPLALSALSEGGRWMSRPVVWAVRPVFDSVARHLLQVLYREYARHDYLNTVIVDAEGHPVDAACEPWPNVTDGPPASVTRTLDAVRESLDRVLNRCTRRVIRPLVRVWVGVGIVTAAALVALVGILV